MAYSLYFVRGVFPELFGKDEWEFFTGTTVASSETSVPLPRWATPDRREIFAMFANTFGMLLNSL